MLQKCTGCGSNEKDKKIIDPNYAMAFAEKTNKRAFIIILVLILLLFATNFAWLMYEMQYEDVVTTTTVQEVEQDADNGTNTFIGGDSYGETNG